jgi:hypothetical protein
MTTGKILTAALLLGVPYAATAQTPASTDAAYCKSLSDTYVRYIGHDEDHAHRRMYLRGSLDGQLAVAQCKEGNTAAAIPVLERQLLANKFTLPARG